MVEPYLLEGEAVVTLFRPVGPTELALIEANQFRGFPPRLSWQPIFYPVLNQDYATEIASNWNVRDSGAGFVTRFAVRWAYLQEFEIKQVGGRRHQEYWIPAEDLEQFNAILIGPIEVVAEFRRASIEERA